MEIDWNSNLSTKGLLLSYKWKTVCENIVLAPVLLPALDVISVFKDSPIGYTIWFVIISTIIDVPLENGAQQLSAIVPL